MPPLEIKVDGGKGAEKLGKIQSFSTYWNAISGSPKGNFDAVMQPRNFDGWPFGEGHNTTEVEHAPNVHIHVRFSNDVRFRLCKEKHCSNKLHHYGSILTTSSLPRKLSNSLRYFTYFFVKAVGATRSKYGIKKKWWWPLSSSRPSLHKKDKSHLHSQHLLARKLMSGATLQLCIYLALQDEENNVQDIKKKVKCYDGSISGPLT